MCGEHVITDVDLQSLVITTIHMYNEFIIKKKGRKQACKLLLGIT